MALLASYAAHHRLLVACSDPDHAAVEDVSVVLSLADGFEPALTSSTGKDDIPEFFVTSALFASSVGPPTAVVARLRVIGIVAPLECPNERVEFGLDPRAGEPVLQI